MIISLYLYSLKGIFLLIQLFAFNCYILKLLCSYLYEYSVWLKSYPRLNFHIVGMKIKSGVRIL
jgi:hypothetical protein